MATPLKSARIKLGLSIREVAEAVGVQQPTINRIENARKRPSPELALRLEEHFDGAITRDQIMYPEKYIDEGKKPNSRARSPRAQKAA